MDLNRFRKLCGIPAPIEETTQQDFEWDRQRIDMLQMDGLSGKPEGETDESENDALPAEPKPRSVADTVVLDLDGHPVTKATHDAVLKEIAFQRDLRDLAKRSGIPLKEYDEMDTYVHKETINDLRKRAYELMDEGSSRSNAIRTMTPAEISDSENGPFFLYGYGWGIRQALDIIYEKHYGNVEDSPVS